MVLRKQCKVCGQCITTKNSKSLGRNEIGLWLNCQCGTTILLKQPEKPYKPTKSQIEAFDQFEEFLAAKDVSVNLDTLNKALFLVDQERLSILETTKNFTRLLELASLKSMLRAEIITILINERKVG